MFIQASETFPCACWPAEKTAAQEMEQNLDAFYYWKNNDDYMMITLKKVIKTLD